MKKKIVFLLLLPFGLQATSLDEILANAQKSHYVETLKQNDLALNAQIKAQAAFEPLELNLGIAHAKNPDENGAEYALGISQSLAYPLAGNAKDTQVSEFSAASQKETEYKTNLFLLEISEQYYMACTSIERLGILKELLSQQEERLVQLEEAYAVGEISKRELLVHRLDLVSLRQEIRSYERESQAKRELLGETVDFMEVGALACSDLREPRALESLQNFEGHARLQAITHRINAANASYAMQDTLLGSLGYALSYEKELDTTRYSFALSIPLGGTSRQKEQNRLEALHTTQSHREELSLLEIQTAHAIQTLSLKIETLVQEYKTMYEEIIPLSQELLDLEKLSYAQGESALLEYLDAGRSYKSHLLQGMQIKQEYYEALFALYKKADVSIEEIK
ncbi:MAG: TolC family protein [Thiovulaceae bacterium]|nr:TolC family protein [Sulfurimonadaceae bacterium]